MASSTGIELGPDTCVLAGVRTTGSGAEVIALHTIEPASWPAHDVVLADTLREIRRSKKFPRRARVVAWGLPEDVTNDAISRAAMRPLVNAGFVIDHLVTPPQALAMLAGTRVKPGVEAGGVAWLALNMHGAAIAIVRGTELLFARTFQWTYNPHLFDGKTQLLQRYSLVAHLGPEVRRGIAAVRASHNTEVEAVVTCGDLPELRSLTMPLIEELDLEVETLDSLDGLRPVGKAKLERLAESAPAIRLACAAALADVQRRDQGRPVAARLAAAAAFVAIVGYGYAYFTREKTPEVPPRAAQTAPRTVTRQPLKPPVTTSRAATAPASSPVAPTVPPNPSTASKPTSAMKEVLPPLARPEMRARPVTTNPLSRSAVVAKAAAPKSGPGTPAAPNAVILQPPAEPDEPASPNESQDAQAKPDVGSRSIDLAPRQQSPAADTRGVVFPRPQPSSPSHPQPLKDALPKVDSILIDQQRRLVIVDGEVVGVGNAIGRRVIAQIDRDAVFLREPSGLLVRVPLHPRD